MNNSQSQVLPSTSTDHSSCEGSAADNIPQPLVAEEENTTKKDDDAIAQTLTRDEFGVEEDASESIGSKLWQIFRPYYILDHFDLESLKIVFRTWIAAWAAMIVIIVPKPHIWLNIASYLLPLVLFLNPPGALSIVQSLTLSVLCMFCVCIGWVPSIIAMAINDQIRQTKWTPTTVTGFLIKEGLCEQGPALALCIQKQLFSGTFIETKTSVISIFALSFAIFILAMLRSSHPLFILPGIVGIISAVITCCYGNFYPYFAPLSVGLLVLKPVGLSISLGVASAILIFPKTSNFSFFNTGLKQLKTISQLSKSHYEYLHDSRPSSPKFGDYWQFRATVLKVKGTLANMVLDLAPTKFEYSYGRFSAGDCTRFMTMLTGILDATSGFQIFYHSVDERKALLQGDLNVTDTHTVNRANSKALFDTLKESYKPVGQYERRLKLEMLLESMATEKSDQHPFTIADLDRLIDLTSTTFGKSLETCSKAVDSAIEWLESANQFRVYTIFPWTRKKYVAKQKENQLKLEEIHAQFQSDLEKLIPDQWNHMIDVDFEHPDLLLSLVGQASMYGFVMKEYFQAIDNLLSFFISIDKETPAPRFLGPLLRNRTRGPRESVWGADVRSTSRHENVLRARDPDANPPSNALHLVGRKTVSVFKIAFNTKSILALKTVAVVVATALPIFCRPTAFWFYSNQLTWVVIVAAFSITEFAGDSVYGFVSKLFYTFAACVLGLVCWYISTGSGKGNFYGMGAVTFVSFFFVAFYRHFSSHLVPIPAVIFCITFILVLGISWQYAQIPTNSVLRFGWSVAWRRLVSVIVALSIAFFASMIPKPSTAKCAVRQTLARIIKEIGNLHCEVGKFAAQRSDDPSVHIVAESDPVLASFRELMLRISRTVMLIKSLKFEPPLKGKWPKEKYQKLVVLLTETLQLYRFLYSLFDQIEQPTVWVSQITSQFGWKDMDISADFFAIIYLSSGALLGGHALPKITPAQITIGHLKLLQYAWSMSRNSKNQQEENVQSALRGHVGEFHTFSYDAQLSTVGLTLMSAIYQRIDGMMLIVKSLVGEEFDADESYLRDLNDDWYEEKKKLI